jgi:hypothetical protein
MATCVRIGASAAAVSPRGDAHVDQGWPSLVYGSQCLRERLPERRWIGNWPESVSPERARHAGEVDGRFDHALTDPA